MRNSFFKRLAPLASLAAQRRYILHATRDSYYVPSELLNDAGGVIYQLRNMPSVLGRGLSEAVIRAILGLEPLLEAAFEACEKTESAEDLIEHDPAWRAAREQAVRCIETMGFDLLAWEKKEGVAHAA